tara:strand:+ start:135 stop:281 length:147 start_codon:yes stop_codon:yes gene_type:complete
VVNGSSPLIGFPSLEGIKLKGHLEFVVNDYQGVESFILMATGKSIKDL